MTDRIAEIRAAHDAMGGLVSFADDDEIEPLPASKAHAIVGTLLTALDAAQARVRELEAATTPSFAAQALAYLGPCGTCDGSGVMSIRSGMDGMRVGDEECAECTEYREAELKKLSAAFARFFRAGAEAMREKAARCAFERSTATRGGDAVAADIRALPLPEPESEVG